MEWVMLLGCVTAQEQTEPEVADPQVGASPTGVPIDDPVSTMLTGTDRLRDMTHSVSRDGLLLQ